ncbi:TolC family protein [Puia dinghuensis]|uniref:Transporter n=1 Tax=Puia dinghuensis TaxID=1792502 RepID=A0A8J2XV50_9BACT|nr:TolC family protein [Puia dinghuensis]GGB15955.1 transporter [Puia dinghuensis]
MRYSSFSLLLLSFALCTTRLDAQSPAADSIGSLLTLHQAVDIAIRNNLVVNQADLQSQTYKVAFDQSWELMLPTLGANAGQGINFGRSLNTTNYTYVTAQTGNGNYNLNAGLTIFAGLQLQNGIKQARYVYDASRLDLRYQKDNITLSVLLAYLSVLSARDQLATIREQENADTVQLSRLENQNREGALLVVSGLTDLRGQVAQDEVNIATAVNNLEAAKVNLFQLMNVPYKRDIDFENSVATANITDYQASPDSIYNSALQTVPNIQSTSLKVMGFQKALAVARGAYFPTLSFNGNVNSYYNSAATALNSNNKIPWGTQFHDNRSEYVGLYLNIPILNGFKVRNNVRNAKINLKNAELTAGNTRLALQQSVELAFQNMIAAYKSYKFYTDQATAYAESFRIQNIRFTEGVITADVYIPSKARSDQAAINLAAAKYAYIFRTKVLDYYQGKLQIP